MMDQSSERIKNGWQQFKHAWEMAGLDPDQLVGQEEIFGTVRLLDAYSLNELSECLTRLATKPLALVNLSRIIARGRSFASSDDIEAVSCFPCLSFVFRDKGKKMKDLAIDSTIAFDRITNTMHVDIDRQGNEIKSIEDGLQLTSKQDNTSMSTGSKVMANSSISDLDLSLRTFNALQRNGISLLSDLAGHDEDWLLGLRGLGSGAVREIIYSLNRCGLELPFYSDSLSNLGNDKQPTTGMTHLLAQQRVRDLNIRPEIVDALEEVGILDISDLTSLLILQLQKMNDLDHKSLVQLGDILSEKLFWMSEENHHGGMKEPSLNDQIILQNISLLREWSSWRGSDKEITLGSVLSSEYDELPNDVRSALDCLISTALTNPPVSRDNRSQLLDDLRAYFDSQYLLILDRRRWTLDPKTLQEVGDELSVSRERVRLLQEKARRILMRYVSNNKKLKWFLHEIRHRTGPLTTRTNLNAILGSYGVEVNSTQWLMLLDLAGPYKIVYEDFVEVSGTNFLKTLIDRTDLMVQNNNQITPAELSEIAYDLGLSDDSLVAELCDKALGLKMIGGMWYSWKGSVIDKAWAVLMADGKPLTAGEINNRIAEGHSQQSLTNGMSIDPRFIKKSKTEWSLSEWGHDEYSGIINEIYKRIARDGGVISIQTLVEDVVRDCGVTENSVRWYLQTPAFLIQGDNVSRRTDFSSLKIESSLAKAKGTYVSSTSVRYELEVTADILRGSGQAIPTGTAIALGVTPSIKTSFVSADGLCLYVGWREWSTSGPDIGSLRPFAEAVSACEGDYIVVSLDIDNHTIEVQREEPSLGSENVLRMLVDTEINRDYFELIAHAIDVNRTEVMSALRARGDERIASMLSGLESGEGNLKVAIDDLLEELL